MRYSLLMFAEMEMTPELLEEFRRQQIVLAHSENEVYDRERDLKSECKTAGIAAIRLNHILETWKGRNTSWSVLRGLRVLDLASGSGYTRYWFGDIWYPQFARLCAVNGADVVAIDSCPQCGLDQQLFTWAAEDLVAAVIDGGLGSLPVLQGRQFDLINSANFIGANSCPELPHQLSRYHVGFDDYEQRFVDQTAGLLVKGGVMSLDLWDKKLDHIIHTKENGALVRLPNPYKTKS